MKKIKLIISLYITCNLLFISKSNAQNVNQFTGGFSYSVPLMTVPSPYGPGVSIGAGYNAGIGVNQGASEIGLGWGINLGGVISRNVSGVPDDWDNAYVADPQNQGIVSQGGVMYFNNHTNRINMDFYKSTYKIDTPAFYFPDYDNYSISGPGIGGSLQPHLFDFATTKLNVFQSTNLPGIKYEMDAAYNFNKKMQFNFSGDYAGNFKSRHYPTNPIGGSTTLRFPGYNDTVTDSEFTSSTVPYTGIGGVGYNSLSNRLATAKYVEYFTNSEINDSVSVDGFTNIPASPARTSTDYEMAGIGAFRITDESGFVYYYTQPVYINTATFGNYPLDNNYKPTVYDGGTTDDTSRTYDSGGNYFIKDNNLSSAGNPFMVEWRQNKRYAYNWLLTAVTGPDYIDSDNNGVVNTGDKGYWVIYDWQPWTKNFTKRSPEYGFDYSFSADENDNTQDLDIANTIHKVSGKFGTFSKFNQEIYYLNKVQTASHTAIMVRDVRLDACAGDPVYDNQCTKTYNIQTENSYTKTSDYGTLYDDGGISGDYGSSKDLTMTISPAGASNITIRFNQFVFANDSGDKIYVKNSGGTILATYTYANPPGSDDITFTGVSSIKIEEVTNTTVSAAGFRMSWLASHPKVTPQLKLTRIVLFKNEDFETLYTPDHTSAYNVSTSESTFDISTAGIDKFYNETWYNHSDNKSNIESKSLQTIEFNQDYSLARKYVNNVKVMVCGADKLSPPSDVLTGRQNPGTDYVSSGKLTLNEILTYNAGHIKTAPSVLFEYNKSMANDDPDYNPVKVDYSGFYKSDASAQGYSSYTSNISKDYTDAWSLRKITSPVGGTIELNYESNEYEKVFDGSGGFRGPAKMYMIKSIDLPSADSRRGIDWTYALEEDVTAPSDFTDLKNSPPSGTVKHVFIPFIDTYSNQKFVNSGTFTFSGSEATSIEKLFDASTISSNHYLSDVSGGVINNSIIPSYSSTIRYTGNGYIHFDLPVGTIAYGGGIRVQSIVTKNVTPGPTDAYVQEYTYSGGVTPMEFDRFGEEKLGNLYYTPKTINIKLRPAAYDHHRMGPGIGYTTVTVKNKGQNNTANGSSTKTFITSDAGIDNFNANIQVRTESATHYVGGSTACTPTAIDTSYMIEVVDKFSGYWGQVQQSQTSDINDNILSRTINEYSNLSQGSIVENYDFVSKAAYSASCGGPVPGPGDVSLTRNSHIVCIKRQYPVILSKQTVYSQGISAVTEYLKFDPITGGAVEVRTTSPNSGITVSKNSPAFRISQYGAMGPKSVDKTNANILSPAAYSKTTVDSTLSSSSDFADYSVQTFKKNFNIRNYSSGSSEFINDPQTNLYWIADQSYKWAGAPGSLDKYGLFKQSQLTSAPFDYTLASIDSKWRFTSQNTLLDNSGHVLEVKAFNNRFSAKKYGYSERLQTAEAANVNYASFTYSGFESTDNNPSGYIDGEIKLNYATKVSTVTAHTGTYELLVPSGATIANGQAPVFTAKYYSADVNKGLLKDRVYRASVWVHSSSNSGCKLSASFPGVTTVSVLKTDASNITAGAWIQMNLDITVSSPSDGNQLKVYLESPSGAAYFDDLMVHPVDAVMSATVYDPITNRVSAKLDGNNFATVYKYDAGGRVVEVWQEIEGYGLKKMKKYQYNYARGL